jgi:uncharacterized protein (TIGR03067 family)
MSAHALWLLVVGASLSAYAPAPLPKKDGDLKKFQGTWEVVGVQIGERILPVEKLGKLRAVIAKDRWSFVRDGRTTSEMVVKLDTKKKPPTIDLTRPGTPGKPILGIYALEGDTLKLCYTASRGEGSTRPTDFAGKGTGRILMTLKRVKP